MNPLLDPRWTAAALDDTPDGVLIEAEGRVVYINRAYVRLLGYRDPPELSHRDVSSIIALADVPRLTDFARWRVRSLVAPASYDFDALRRDGSTLPLHASVAASKVQGTTFITSIVRPGPEPADHRTGSEGQVLLTDSVPHHSLSPRETEVLRMILVGTTPKKIGLALNISVKTVATHRSRMMQKMALKDDRGIFEYAVRYGLVDWTREH